MMGNDPQGRERGSTDGIGKALQKVFQPDHAADDVLGRLIDRLDDLPWPQSSDPQSPPQS